MPRSYQAYASLWAFRRFEIITTTGPESDLQSTPAETQATALTALLQVHAFALSVAKATSLPSTLPAADPAARDDALINAVSKVQVVAQAYNLFVITYTNSNPEVAQQVVQAVITNFGLQSQGFSFIESQPLLAGLQAQLAKAKEDAATAVAAESKYIGTHPSLSKTDLLNDPEYQLLQAQAQNAQTAVSNVQTNIDTINQQVSAQGSGVDTLFKVLDAPFVQGVSRTKTYLMGGGIGLGLAIAGALLYVIFATRRDRSVYTPLDLQKVAALPVVMQLPYLTGKTIPLLIEGGSPGDIR
ncbi:MAG TPA: hypothetical protein VF043_00640 [Ktedonobacteraceae bacterium]